MSTVSEAIDVRGLIAEILDTSPYADPLHIAEEVMGRLTRPADIRAALLVTLPTYVTQTITKRRVSPSTEIREPGSSKYRQMSSILRRREQGEEEWKFLRDFTSADLIAAATRRRNNADGLIANAERLERLAKEIVERGVETVGQLPEDIVQEVLG